MSNKVSTITDKFLKYGMDISSYKISNEVEKYEFYYYIQIYVSEILRKENFSFIFDNHLFIIDDYGPLLAFAMSEDYKTVIPVALTTSNEDLCKDIVKCFLIMVKDMRDMMPHIISDVAKDEQIVLNKIKDVNFYKCDHKKYDLSKLSKEMKKI